MNFKINQVVKVKEEFENEVYGVGTVRFKDGSLYNQFRIVSLEGDDVVAVNLGSFRPWNLKEDHLELIPDPLAYNVLKKAYTNNSYDKEAIKYLNI